ncbi:glycine cleavage system aminomethyltransferase GcvT [Longispora albida]|uniref:glycine cleavage system aminomethyltransferase GcvT n=1 Tax=Longispora albida TaxID=203523 RepID=UPI00035EE7DC|nr:glycine cleavage system aminomethyltransferase GcvT [Longispora albida]
MRTALYEHHLALGATLTDYAGWRMPLRYGSETAEHLAVRASAGMFDLGHMGQFEFTGWQAAEALDYALVGRLSELKPGQARYTLICQADGGILDDLIVYRLEEDQFMLVANAGNTSLVHEVLSVRLAAFDAQVTRIDQSLIALQGPSAAGILALICDAHLGGLPYYSITPGMINDVPLLVARTGYTGEDGFELYVPAEHASAVWWALSATGEPHGLRSAGLACRDTLRLEAGMPLYGHELDASTTPYDAGLGRVVRLDKPGDFVGREALTAAAESPRRKRLVGLVSNGRRVLRAGQPVVDARTREPVGEVTSGAASPSLRRPIAMAYVSTVNAPLAVDIRGTLEPVDLSSLPFYRRSKS